jgi:hypothetical protein
MYGFSLIKSEHIAELEADALLYIHTSGARLVFVKNEDENRVVMPVFGTLPENDRGTAHIVEHCTLCGSDKYPLKDPFNVLEKGSIYTYLNAITYEDKTVYPVASTDTDELEKMARVYADALFRPSFLSDEGIFRQEGIYKGEDGLNGVVFNEMKGAFSSEGKKLRYGLRKALYSSCGYENYSGGVPKHIPELGYEEFKRFYKERYGGANCLIYIYGAVEIEVYMKLFDGYLKDRIPKSDCTVKANTVTEPIEIKAGESANGLCGVLWNCCRAESYEECIFLSVLGEVLVSGENSVMRELFVDSGKAVKVGGGYDDSSRATVMFAYAEGTDIAEFKTMLNQMLAELAENGLPVDKVESAVDRLKFYIKEKDFGYKPIGLFYGLELMKGMLYEDESFAPLNIEEMLDKSSGADYCALIRKYLLNKGAYGYTVKADEDEPESDMPINDESLKRFQAKQDTAEALSLIKPKPLKELSPKPIWFDYDFADGCLFTEGKGDIVYLDLIYPIAELDISAAALYSRVAAYMEKDFSEAVERRFGKFYLQADSFTKDENGIPLLAVTTSFMRENMRECVELIKRLISGIRLNDTDRLARLISEYKADFKRGFTASGNVYALKRVLAQLNPNDVLKDKAGGIGLYQYLGSGIDFLHELIEVSEYIAKTKPIAVLRGSTSDRRYIIENIPLGDTLPKAVKINEKPLSQTGFIIPGEVNYNAVALKMPCYNGFAEVAESIIERGYIWDNIRLKGGAYGGGCGFLRNNTMYLYSYRDPQLKATMETFKRVGDYLSTLKLTESEFERFAIGSISELLKPRKNKTVNLTVLSQAILERSLDTETELVKQRLGCTQSDIRALGKTISDKINSAALTSTTLGGNGIAAWYEKYESLNM